ncbi:MAG: hypothetical protein QM664_13590, partial [Flavihumibacter sp.]
RENISNDFYYNYTLDSLNHPVDSTLTQNGWLRRPTDRLITLGLFFQDYLSTNKNFKVYINTLYGTNLPYNIPQSVKYRNALVIDPYLRIDLGFSALLLNTDKTKRKSNSMFRQLENIWASLEIFNVIDRRQYDFLPAYQRLRKHHLRHSQPAYTAAAQPEAGCALVIIFAV